MGWTTRNHDKSGSNPSLKLAVAIQSSVSNAHILTCSFALFVSLYAFPGLLSQVWIESTIDQENSKYYGTYTATI